MFQIFSYDFHFVEEIAIIFFSMSSFDELRFSYKDLNGTLVQEQIFDVRESFYIIFQILTGRGK